ncbi:hypothetical protein ACE1TI_20270 [Alteribacillus sp. JSM 102045]|uniref:hypothetical protein n=1 Tax=Alteribacillus sp. JSM 102045 TaxID=1562101 RepID=UPI0035C1A1B1
MCEGFWACISPDAWLQTFGTIIGAFLGTLLAGFISLHLYLKKQKDQTKNETRGFKRKFILHYYAKTKTVLAIAKDISFASEPSYIRHEALYVLINDLKKYYLREVEPVTPIDLHPYFEEIYMKLVNIQTFTKYTSKSGIPPKTMEMLGVDTIVKESIEAIEGTIDQLQTVVEEKY